MSQKDVSSSSTDKDTRNFDRKAYLSVGDSASTEGNPSTSDRLARNAGSSPLWMQVRDDLKLRIRKREFPDIFPGETDLAHQYGVSRQTMRHALRELREKGVISSGQGRPSRVLGTGSIEQPVGVLYSLFASVEKAGMSQRSRVQALEVRVEPSVAEKLGLDNSTELLYLERLRLADDLPLAIDQVWMPASKTLSLLDSDFTNTALYNELDTRCGIRLTGGYEWINAVVPSERDRQVLQIAENTAAFAIERYGMFNDELVECRFTLIRGDRFSALAEFDNSDGYQIQLSQRRYRY